MQQDGVRLVINVHVLILHPNKSKQDTYIHITHPGMQQRYRVLGNTEKIISLPLDLRSHHEHQYPLLFLVIQGMAVNPLRKMMMGLMTSEMLLQNRLEVELSCRPQNGIISVMDTAAITQ